jgi:hypothetical protein
VLQPASALPLRLQRWHLLLPVVLPAPLQQELKERGRGNTATFIHNCFYQEAHKSCQPGRAFG